MIDIEEFIKQNIKEPIASYVFVASTFDEDGRIIMHMNAGEEQPIYMTAGLLEFAKACVAKQFNEDLDQGFYS